MPIEYFTNTTELAPNDRSPDFPETDAPVPVPPAGSGWKLILSTVSSNRVYYVWQRGTSVEVVTTTYTVADTVDTILADATGGAFTITLPNAANVERVTVKKTDASANVVTVDGGTATIDGNVTQAISFQYESFTFASDGTNYFLV